MVPKFEVSKALKGKFEVLSEVPCLYSRVGFIDFRTITVAQAEELSKSGSRYIQKIVKPSKSNKKQVLG